MVVYELRHICFMYEQRPFFSDINLGYYSDIHSADSAVNHYSALPGFGDCKEGFLIRPRKIEGDVIDGNIFTSTVYIHSEDLEFEYVCDAGLFADEISAEAAADEIISCNDPGNGSLIVEKIVERYALNDNAMLWSEGFKTYTYKTEFRDGVDILPYWVDGNEL